MKTLTHFGAVIGAMVMLGGCSTINNFVQKVSVDPVMTFTKAEKDKLTEKQQYLVIALDDYRFPEDKGIEGSKTAFARAATEKVLRDRLQSIIMARSDKACPEFRKFIFAAHSTRKLIMRSLTLALSGAGAIVSGAAQAFSGASAGIQGFDETFDAEVLQGQQILLIEQAISSTRSGLRDDIDEKRKLDINDYPTEEAIQDTVRYHSLCSLTLAVTQLGTAVKENQSNKKKVRALTEELEKVKNGKKVEDLKKKLPKETTP